MIAKVQEVLLEDIRQVIHDVCDRVGPSYGSCQCIQADELNTKKIAAKFVRFLNNDQWDHRVQVCTELQKAVTYDPNFLSRVITGDESWLYNYDPETKQQYAQWKTQYSPRPKKACQVRSNIKSMLIIFIFDIRGIVHKEFVPPGQTVNWNLYWEVFRRLRESVRHKRPEMWKNGDWLLHQDNDPAHT